MKSANYQYAHALADVAMGQGDSALIAEQLAGFGIAFQESAELRNFLTSPAVKPESKHAVLEKIVERLGASKIVRNFLFIVADHQRFQILPEIITAFEEVLRQRQGIAEAEVSSAVELTMAQKTELTQGLERLTGKKIDPKYSLDPSLLGGAVARIGDTVYDGSIKKQLKEMSARLAAE